MPRTIDVLQKELLDRRSRECADAMSRATLLYIDQEITSDAYRSFIKYLMIRQALDTLTAVTEVEFEIANNDKELDMFSLAASRCLEDNKHLLSKDLLPLAMGKGVFVYAYLSNNFTPIGTIFYLSAGARSAGVEYGLMPGIDETIYKPTLQKAVELIGSLDSGH